jgi:heat shock protein HslJ/uncharacterized membrane protein
MGQVKGLAALVAGSLAAAASGKPAMPDPFRAAGVDPAWILSIEDGRIAFTPAGGPPVSVKAPKREDSEIGWSYETSGLKVHAYPSGCDMPASTDRYRYEVGIEAGALEYEGCGGEKLPAGSLLGTSWMITSIAGAEVRGPSFAIDFHPESGFIAYTGCKRVGGEWRQEGDRLAMSPTGHTMAECRDPVGGCERRLLQILTRPMTVTYEDRRTAMLTNEAGSVKLWKPGKEDDLFETRISLCPALP